MIYNLFGQFEWDEEKAQLNLSKHGVRFAEATTIWWDKSVLEIFDSENSLNEERWVRIGYSSKARLLTVVFSETEHKTRIISARKSTTREQELYHERTL